MKLLISVLLIAACATSVAQHQLKLKSGTVLHGKIIHNSPDQLWMKDGDNYMLVTKKNLAELSYNSNNFEADLSNFDQLMPPQNFISGGDLIAKGASNMNKSIWITLCSGLVAGLFYANDDYTIGTMLLVSANVLSLGIQVSGISQIKRGGLMLSAKTY